MESESEKMALAGTEDWGMEMKGYGGKAFGEEVGKYRLVEDAYDTPWRERLLVPASKSLFDIFFQIKTIPLCIKRETRVRRLPSSSYDQRLGKCMCVWACICPFHFITTLQLSVRRISLCEDYGVCVAMTGSLDQSAGLSSSILSFIPFMHRFQHLHVQTPFPFDGNGMHR